MAAGGPPTLGRFERDDGNASLLFLDPQVPQDFNLFVFGAGHVGRALVNSLAALPCRITWWTSGPRRFRRRCPTT